METYFRFLFEFMSVFFNGIGTMISGILNGFIQVFNIQDYLSIIGLYQKEFSGGEWVLAILAIIVMIVILGLIILSIVFLVRKYIRFRKTLVEQESMLKEIGMLNNKVADLVQEKEKILAMKVSQLGLKPGEEATIEEETISDSEEENSSEVGIIDDDPNARFSKLHSIDVQFKDYKIQDYGNSFTLEELVEEFRNFAASKLKLYYTTNMIRLFIFGLSVTK